MAFVTIDNKNWCKGVYKDGKLHQEQLPEELDRTWKFCSYLEDKSIEYASIYALGKTIGEVCPSHLEDSWEELNKRLLAYYNSFKESKISLDDNCFYDLVPKQFLLEFCELKSRIIESVFRKFPKPKNYDQLLAMEKLIAEIADNELNLDLEWLKGNLTNPRARLLYKKIKNKNKVKYKLFGSKTGRLSIEKNTFPILNLDKDLKRVIRPTNDLLVELDYNSAEVRVLLHLSGQEQPTGDIHQANAKRLGISRDDAKREIFAWLYGSSKVDSSKYEKLFDLSSIMGKYYDGQKINNPFGRAIESDDYHKLNYLIQSTTADLVFEQTLKIRKMLHTRKSRIAFLVHDSIVIDLAKEDKHLVNSMIQEFRNTRFGALPVNISAGKDYGNLKDL